MYMRSGFTLIEISVVLVIIAFLSAGILVGTSLIKNAESQAVIADVDRYKKAASAFRDKYKYLPGDLPNASTFWGDDFPCPAGTGTNFFATCGGNGNGLIGGPQSGSSYSSAYNVGALGVYEAIRVWQHLANAGFINGSFTGSINPGQVYNPGVNVPAIKSSDVNGYLLFYASPVSATNLTPDGVSHPRVWPGEYGHVIEYGMLKNTSGLLGAHSPALTAEEALSIDRKIDDGFPSTGNVLSFTRAGTAPPALSICASADATPVYDVTQPGPICSLIFVTGL